MVSKSLLEYINNNIKDCTDRLDLAYTIYILLGKVLYYSPLYARYKLDNLVPDISSVSLDNPFVNCETWSILYNELLQLYEIDSKVVGDKHKLVEIKIDDMVIRGDATTYLPDGLFDISSDLTNIKFGLDILYFRLVDNKYREEFNKRIKAVNERFNINKGIDSNIINTINNSKANSEKERINYGIQFYNKFYEMCDGEVERRQLFERYYPLLFEGINNSVIDIYDNGILSKHLIIFGLDDKKYCVETTDGFIEVTYDDVLGCIDDKSIVVRYSNDINKIYEKTNCKYA